jgi:lauroyl/myristoyl acyltransferase
LKHHPIAAPRGASRGVVVPWNEEDRLLVTDWGYIAAGLVARLLPRFASGAIADTAADLYTWTHPARTRAIGRRLSRIWVESGRSGPVPSARDTNRAFARAVRDFLANRPQDGAARRVRLDEEARSILRAARESGRSTVLVSGHFGPWEVALQWLAREVGPLDALARSHRCGAVERFFASRRAAFGVRTLSGGRPAAAALARLRAGGWIAALADRSTRHRVATEARKRAAANTAPTSMVRVDPAPLLLARRTRSQVLAGVAWQADDGAVEVRFHPAFTLAPRRDGIGLDQAQARLQRFFDAHVRAHPTQWFDWSLAPGLDRGADPLGG